MEEKKDILQKEYRERFATLEAYRNSVWSVLCDDYFSRFIDPGFNVLDLGAGWGEFINNIKATKKYAMDLNPDTEKQLSDEVSFLHQDCSEKWQLPDESLDLVFTSNFFEHLPDKESIEKSISEASRCLKKGGMIVCLGPNIRYVGGAYWDFWDHYIPISDRSLSELLTLKGFSVEKSIDRFLPYTMSGGKPPPLFMLKLYLKLPFFWRFFGKQFFVLARKG